MEALEKVIRNLHLWQYYVLDPARETEAVKSAISSGEVEVWKGPDVKGKNAVELAHIFRTSKLVKGLGQFAKRFGVHVDGGIAAGFVKAAFGNSEAKGPEEWAALWKTVVDVLNVDLYKEWEDDTKVAIENVRNRAKYMRLDDHGDKLGLISKE
jgi:glycogen debranching enzyme